MTREIVAFPTMEMLSRGQCETIHYASLEILRRAGVRTEVDYGGRSLKGQLTHARRLGARAVVEWGPESSKIRRPGQQDEEVPTAVQARPETRGAQHPETRGAQYEKPTSVLCRNRRGNQC